MDREVIATGLTVDEAIAAACEKLGAPRENVDIEVLEMPKKKFFGLKTVPAKVKAVLQDEYANKFLPKEPKKTEKKQKEQPKEQQQKRLAPEAKAEKPAVKQEKAEKPAEKAPVEQKKAPQKQQKPQQKKEQPKKEAAKEAPVPAEPSEKEEPAKQEIKELEPAVLELKGGEAAAYIKDVLVALGHADANVTYTQKDGMIVLQLSGADMGAVVGRRGDNLDAMQYLASLVANRSEGSYVRVVLDVDDYRSKREASLRAYARKMAVQAVKGQRAITLEAMNPYERRIVHSTVQTVSGATSKSTGSEPNRRVVISPIAGAKPRREDGGKRRFDGNKKGGRGGRGDRGPKRESQKVVVPQSNEPPKNDTSAISLYGRIDLD